MSVIPDAFSHTDVRNRPVVMDWRWNVGGQSNVVGWSKCFVGSGPTRTSKEFADWHAEGGRNTLQPLTSGQRYPVAFKPGHLCLPNTTTDTRRQFFLSEPKLLSPRADDLSERMRVAHHRISSYISSSNQ